MDFVKRVVRRDENASLAQSCTRLLSTRSIYDVKS